jgi:hypothetical protein
MRWASRIVDYPHQKVTPDRRILFFAQQAVGQLHLGEYRGGLGQRLRGVEG